MSLTLPELASAAIGFTSGLIICAIQLINQHLRIRAAQQRIKVLRRRLNVERHNARHDPLTGLPNRRALWPHLANALRDTGHPVAVAVIDVDRFKEINDAVDHEFGDKVLVDVGATLAALPVALATRLGGDEFALLIDGDDRDAVRIAHLARDAIARTVHPPGKPPIDLTVTVGYAVAVAGDSARDLVRRADLANRHAKRHRLGIHP